MSSPETPRKWVKEDKSRSKRIAKATLSASRSSRRGLFQPEQGGQDREEPLPMEIGPPISRGTQPTLPTPRPVHPSGSKTPVLIDSKIPVLHSPSKVKSDAEERRTSSEMSRSGEGAEGQAASKTTHIKNTDKGDTSLPRAQQRRSPSPVAGRMLKNDFEPPTFTGSLTDREGWESEEYNDCSPGPSQTTHLTTHLESIAPEMIRKMELSCCRLLLVILKKLDTEELRSFQDHLTASLLPDYPPIPMKYLMNVTRQATVDQMVQKYNPEGAVIITKRILMMMHRNDLTEEMRRRGLLLATLENMNSYGLQSFKTPLMTCLPGYPTLQRSQLENADRQETVDQMVQRYGSDGAVKATLEILKILNRNDLFEKLYRAHNRTGLLLATLEKLNTFQLTRFQSLLTTGMPGYPLIPKSHLKNVDRQETVDQMVLRYDSEGAVKVTLKILRKLNRNDLVEKLMRHLNSEGLLLATLEKLDIEELKSFQSLLNTGMPGYPPIPESLLKNADRHDTVDQMVQRYDSEGAVKVTLKILRKLNRKDLVEKLMRDLNSEGLLLATLTELNNKKLKRFQSLLTAGMPGYPPIPESQLKNADRHDTVDQMVQRYDSEGAVKVTLKILWKMTRNDLVKKLMRDLNSEGLLLATLEKLDIEELKSFQSLLNTGMPGYPPIPESLLKNVDSQDIVNQMVQRYDSEGAVKVTLKILRKLNRKDLVEKLMRDLNSEGLLLATLTELNNKKLRRFQSLLTAGMPGYPPIPESQLKNADRHDTVDQMVQRYNSEGAVKVTLKILWKMTRNDLVKKLMRDLNSEGLLLATLEKLDIEELKSFQSLLNTGMPGYPSIPESLLKNVDSQDIVNQMVQRYDSEGAVKVTLKILRKLKRNDLAKKLMRDLNSEGLLLATLTQLKKKKLKRFQSLLTTGMPGYPPIPESLLKNADRQDTVDQMVQRYDSEGAVKVTLKILRKLNRNHLVKKLMIDLNSEGLLLATLTQLDIEELKSFQSLLTTGMPGYPPIPESLLKNVDSQDTVDQMVQRYDSEGAVKVTLKILRKLNRNDLVKKLIRDLNFEGLLLATLMQLDIRELNSFQSLLTAGMPGYPPIPESLLKNADRQDTVDQMVLRYGSEGAVKVTLEILSKLNRNDLVEKLMRDLNSEGLLLAILEKLDIEELKSFQSLLNTGMPGYPPIPESLLKNVDRQDTVDQMVLRYDSGGAVNVTLEILRKLNRNDLTEQLRKVHKGKGATKCAVGAAFSKPSSSVRVSKPEDRRDVDSLGSSTSTSGLPVKSLSGEAAGIPKSEDSPDTASKMMAIVCGPSVEVLENNPVVQPTTSEADDPRVQLRRHFTSGASRPLPRPRSWPGSSASSRVSGREGRVRRSLSHSCPNLLIPVTSADFTPDVIVHENKQSYRFQCLHAGVFQCRITGLVFGMEGEGELLYRTVTWDRMLLARSGKRPAGPLFKFTRLKGSACQLHLPHSEILSAEGCDHLSVIHVTGRHVGFKQPYMTTDTHVIINITGFCKYGLTKDEGDPTKPIRGHVVLFFEPVKSMLSVLLLPFNTDINMVKKTREERSDKREIYIEEHTYCKLIHDQKYHLSTNPRCPVKPKMQTAIFYEDDTNYVRTFGVTLVGSVDEIKLTLTEEKSNEDQGNDQSECVWTCDLSRGDIPLSEFHAEPSVSSDPLPVAAHHAHTLYRVIAQNGSTIQMPLIASNSIQGSITC